MSVYPNNTIMVQPMVDPMQQQGLFMGGNMMAGGMPTEAPKWAPTASSRAGCPPGLEALVDLDQVKIIEDVNQMDAISPISLPNRYSVRNMNDEQIYFAAEAASPMQASVLRQIDVTLVDADSKMCMAFRRLPKDVGASLTCAMLCPACCGDWLSKMEARDGNNQTLGMIRELNACCAGRIQIENTSNSSTFEAAATCCNNFANANTVFTVDYNGSRGEIQRLYGGLRARVFQADSFTIAFPKDLDVVSKALTVATTILIDYMYYENKPYRRHRRGHQF